MASAADTQQGATIAFATDSTDHNIISIGRCGTPIPVLDKTHLGTTDFREKLAGELKDAQPVTVVAQADPAQAHPTIGTAQTITITSPLASGGSSAETLAGTGFVTDVRSQEFNSESEGIQTIEIDFIFDGDTGPTRTLAS